MLLTPTSKTLSVESSAVTPAGLPPLLTLGIPAALVLALISAPALGQSATVLPAGTLTNPIGMFVDAQDRVWIGEAGTGLAGPTGPPSASGNVRRYDPATGTLQTVFTGFLSFSSPSEPTPVGVHHMAQDPNSSSAILIAQGGGSGSVESWDENSALNPAFSHDVSGYLTGQGLGSNTYSVAADTSGNLYAVDAGANAIVKIDPVGGMSIFATFPNLSVGQDSVPTKIVATTNGFYVCNLTGAPFVQGSASLFHVDMTGTVTTVETGFTTLVDVAVDPTDGRPVVLSTGTFGPMGPMPHTGTATKITISGTHTVASGLTMPTGMGYASNGDLYVHSYAEGWLAKYPSSQLSLSVSEVGPPGGVGLYVAVENGVSGDPYYLFHSLDPTNATFPGGGWLGGLHIDVSEAFLQASAGMQPGNSAFGGILGSNGGITLEIPSAAIAPYSGMQIWATALSLTSGNARFSNIATFTIQ